MIKPCNDCDKKPDCRIICKDFSKWLDNDQPDGPILTPAKVTNFAWTRKPRPRGITICPKRAALAGKPNKATERTIKTIVVTGKGLKIFTKKPKHELGTLGITSQGIPVVYCKKHNKRDKNGKFKKSFKK